MPKHTDTYARAYDCCDLILIELGRFPSIDLIRDHIGVNSPVTIKKAMNEWTQHFAETHFDKINRPDIPATLLHSVEQVWKLAVIEAEKIGQQKEKDLLQTLADTQAELSESQLNTLVLNKALKEARAGGVENERQILELRQQLENKEQENKNLRQQLTTNEKQLSNQQLLMQEQEKRRQQQQEQDQAWFARRITEEKQFSEEKWQEKVQRQAMQITALIESEISLRQLCSSLRHEQQSLQQALAVYQNDDKKVNRFKSKSRFKEKSSRR